MEGEKENEKAEENGEEEEEPGERRQSGTPVQNDFQPTALEFVRFL